MKFSIGDPVYVKSNDEEGRIEEFIGKDQACIRVDKATYHVFLDDLEHPYLRWFTQKKSKNKTTNFIDQIRPEQKVARQTNLPMGMYLAFVPIYEIDGFDEKISKLKIYLYNELPHDFLFNYDLKIKNKLSFSLEGDIKEANEFYIHDISFEEAASNPHFCYRFIDKNDDSLDYEDILNIKPKKLFDNLDEIKFANKAIFYIRLFDKIVAKKRQEVHVQKNKNGDLKKPSTNSSFNFAQIKQKSIGEIDLHIEKLSPDYQHLAPSEILYIQLKECQMALDLAIATYQNSLIIIHGVGKGTLRNEIHLLLNQTNHIKEYVYEYDVRYGYGATKVFFAY